MSIYSGFATRHQEQLYDQLIHTVLYLFQKRLVKFYKNQAADQEKFMGLLVKLSGQMKKMEVHKYLEPKASVAFDQLIQIMKIKQLDQASIKVVGNPQSCVQQEISSQNIPKKSHNHPQITYKPPNKYRKKSHKNIKSNTLQLHQQTPKTNNIINPSPPTQKQQFLKQFKSINSKSRASSHDRNHLETIFKKGSKRNRMSSKIRRDGNKSLMKENQNNCVVGAEVGGQMYIQKGDAECPDIRCLIRQYIQKTKRNSTENLTARKY